ncbi:MAG: NAD-dependent protein deacetylase, SIR2 family [Eubacteriales bacterium]|nr:NAD-dependent protein deacetylase, SIR2 family [Eubacteriales bacterium]
MNQLYKTIKAAIESADAILIGASNGLSISEGYHIFADNQWFRENFGDFRQRYGIHSVLEGVFYPYPSPQVKWAFYSRLIAKKCYQEEPGQMMKNLFHLVKDKDYFVITSNGEDHFAPAGFDRNRVFEIEGRMTLSTCSAHCCEDVYENKEDVLRMAQAEKNGIVPENLLPRCPKCGAVLAVDVADGNEFFQRRKFQEKMQDYQRFVQKYHGKKLVILEFGVGWRNRMIKEPLMQLTAAEPEAVYITFNKGELYIPEAIVHKSIGVDGDIGEALASILAVRP